MAMCGGVKRRQKRRGLGTGPWASPSQTHTETHTHVNAGKSSWLDLKSLHWRLSCCVQFASSSGRTYTDTHTNPYMYTLLSASLSMTGVIYWTEGKKTGLNEITYNPPISLASSGSFRSAFILHRSRSILCIWIHPPTLMMCYARSLK